MSSINSSADYPSPRKEAGKGTRAFVLLRRAANWLFDAKQRPAFHSPRLLAEREAVALGDWPRGLPVGANLAALPEPTSARNKMCLCVTLAGALLGTITGSAGATTLVAVWTPTVTVIGADSLIHTLDDKKRWSICKIRRAASVVWSATGLTGNPDFNFSLDRLGDEAMSGPGSLDAKIKAFETALLVPLSEVVHATRVENPSWHYRHAEGMAVTRLIFIANEDGVNRFRMLEFVAKSARIGDEIDIIVKRTDCPGPACQDFRVFLLGNYDYASRIANEAGIWEKNGWAEGVRRSIEPEIASNPDHVGPPIAIAEVTTDGVRWVEKGECSKK